MRGQKNLPQVRIPTASQSLAFASSILVPLSALAEEVAKADTDSKLSSSMTMDDGMRNGLFVLGASGVFVLLFKGLIAGGGLYYLNSLREESNQKNSLQRALDEFLGETDEPEEFLTIERLNDKLESYEYSFNKASVSKTAALRPQVLKALQRRFGIDLASFDLDSETIDKIKQAAEKYSNKDYDLKKKLGEALAEARADVLKIKKDGSPNFGSITDRFFGNKFAKAQALQRKRFDGETEFLSALSDALPASNASALAETFKPSFLGDDTRLGVGSLDAISALQEASTHTQSNAKHVWALEFFGDVQASQVKNLRKEVTAVIRSANVSRGDEVVLVLNTGGGTVVGYGLAGAQLDRIKKAGLRLTVCVEQIAASGGYLMGCVAHELVASPFAVLGSVGVITEIPNAYERLKKEGLVFKTATAGKYKRTVTPTKKITPEDEKKLAEDLEKVLVLFKSWVTKNRPTLDIEKIATGETWFGPDALEMKLVDRLATLDDVLLEHIDNGAEVFSVKAEKPRKAGPAFLKPKGFLDVLKRYSSSNDALSLFSRMLSSSKAPYDGQGDWLQSQDVIPRFTETDSHMLGYQAMMKKPEGSAEPRLYWEDGNDRMDQTWNGF